MKIIDHFFFYLYRNVLLFKKSNTFRFDKTRGETYILLHFIEAR